MGLFSSTFERVGFSSQTETSIFRCWHAGVSRKSEYLSTADPNCTTKGDRRRRYLLLAVSGLTGDIAG